MWIKHFLWISNSTKVAAPKHTVDQRKLCIDLFKGNFQKKVKLGLTENKNEPVVRQ